MSIFLTRQVACDFDDHSPSSPCDAFVEGLPAETAREVRIQAKRRGWVRIAGHDYCPKHKAAAEATR